MQQTDIVLIDDFSRQSGTFAGRFELENFGAQPEIRNLERIAVAAIGEEIEADVSGSLRESCRRTSPA